MNCRRVNSLLSAYLDGELTGVEMLAIRAHLDQCSLCALEHETLRETKRLVASLVYKAPRVELEALLMSDAAQSNRFADGYKSVLESITDWARADQGSLLKPRPLAATVFLSIAGLYLASAALDGPGDGLIGADHSAASYPALVAAGGMYMSPAALTLASAPTPGMATWVASATPYQGSYVAGVSLNRAITNGNVAALTSWAGPDVNAPVNPTPPGNSLAVWGTAPNVQSVNNNGSELVSMRLSSR